MRRFKSFLTWNLKSNVSVGISSYRVKVTHPQNAHTHARRQDRLQYTAPQLRYCPENISSRDLNPNCDRGLPITRTAAIVTASERAV